MYPKLQNGYLEAVPEVAIEVLSPDTCSLEIARRKVEQYLKSGWSLVWVFDPELRTVTVYRPKQQPDTLEESETISGEKVLPGFSCRVAEFFD